MTYHAQSGSIFKHFISKHNSKPTREILVNNTNIIAFAENRYKLAIKEALLIKEKGPSINKQFDNFVSILKLSTHRNLNSTSDLIQIDISEGQPEKSSQEDVHGKDKKSFTDARSAPDMPDFETVLRSFGILHENLKEIPLNEYVWRNFDGCQEVEAEVSSEDFTISQRIKSLRRKARH